LTRHALLLLTCGGFMAAHAAAPAAPDADQGAASVEASATAAAVDKADPAAQPAAARGKARRHAPESVIDRRLKLLTAELKLDASQQVGVKKVLEGQHDQMTKAWSADSSVPSAVRVKTTQSIADHTADQIRALLNEEQRQKYIRPRQSVVKVGGNSADLEAWIGKNRPK
jgi:hypothetical protein